MNPLMGATESSAILSHSNQNTEEVSSLIQRTQQSCLECLLNFSCLKCISRIGLVSSIVSVIATVGLFIAGCVIRDEEDNLGYKLLGIALGTMVLTVCCFGIVFLPCYDGECHVDGPCDFSSDIGGGAAAF